MTWRVVAAKDVRDALRSRAAVVAALALALTFGLVAYGGGALARFRPRGDGTATTADLLAVAGGEASWFVAAVVGLVGLVLSNEAVAGERATGSVKVLLGLPHARWSVVAGTLVGRAVVTAAAVGVGMVGAAAVVATTYDGFAPLPIVGLAVATAALATAYVGVGVGISAAVSTTRRATAAAAAFFLVTSFGWDSTIGPRLVLYLATERVLPPSGPHWFDQVVALSPGGAYGALLEAGGPLAGNGPLALVVLAAWTVVPPALGYLRFRGADVT